MFRERKGGKVSLARVAAGITLAFGLTWGSWVAYKSGTMPELGGLTALVGSLYGSNKIGTAISELRK